MSHRAVKYIKKVGHFNPAVPQRVNQGAVRRKNYYEGVLFLMFSYMKLKDEDELVRELVRLVRSTLSVRFVTAKP